MARRKPFEPPPAPGIDDVPPDLAEGPAVEIWGQHPTDVIGAWRAWKDARLAWCVERGIADSHGFIDWHRLPDQLYSRAPYYKTKARTSR